MPLVALVAALLTLHSGANGHRYVVSPATTVVVVLPSNASTGYHWRLSTPLDRSVLRLVSHRYTAAKSGRPGAAGKETWRFRAVGKGLDHLRLAYVPPGQSGKAGRHFGVTICVG